MKELLVAGLALAGCTRVETSNRAMAKPSEVSGAAGVAAPSGIEADVLALAACPLEGYQIESTCPAMEALAAELRAHPMQLSLALGDRLLTNPAPPVRIQAAAMLADYPDAVVDATRREGDPRVRRAMLHALEHVRSPRVAQLVLDSTQHGAAEVRAEALALLAAHPTPGAADRVRAMAERDPDPALRRAACRTAGALGDPALVPVLAELTANASDPELYAACMEGVVAMADGPHGTRDAYHLFLDRIRTAPRDAQSPPWQVMSAFCNETGAAPQHAPWFDTAEVKATFAAVIADPHTGSRARAAALESMAGL